MAQDGKILTVGTAATELDIYITAGQNGAPLDPTSIIFRIFDPTGVEAVTETVGHQGWGWCLYRLWCLNSYWIPVR